MESLQNIKRRIKGVGNIGQITKAMELVAATKMRKSQEIALGSRPYAYTALEILASLSKLEDVPMPVLMQAREIKKTLMVVITSDKGLAGSFNGTVIRTFERFINQNPPPFQGGVRGGSENSKTEPLPTSPCPPKADPPLAEKGEGLPRYQFLAIGQKAKQYFERRNMPLVNSFVRAGDYTKRAESDPIAEFIIDGYQKGDWDEVIAFSTVFVTALRQDVLQRQLLPVNFEKMRETVEELIPRAGRYSHYLDPDVFDLNRDTNPSQASQSQTPVTRSLPFAGEVPLIEPSPREVLEKLAPELLKIRLYDWIMESNASEHSARRVAMKNASENANELSENLSVEYNKSRQASITNQIIEVTSGSQAAN
jgi:F-type H+-transporting ATPase subunit gamma